MKSEKWNRQNLAITGINSQQFPNEQLFDWLRQPRNPVLASDNPFVKMFIEAMMTGEKTEFIYIGGTTPGLPRMITVSLVFQHTPEGRIYIAGYCHTRGSNRVFALDLTMVVWSQN